METDIQDSYLLNLPSEILYLIFTHINSHELFFTVRRVCKRFYTLLSHEGFFMVRFKKKHFRDGVEFPILQQYNFGEEISPGRSDHVSWRELEVRMDLREQLWGCNKPCEHKVFGAPHSATIHTVKMFDKGRLFVSGGRDRLLCMWNVESIPESEPVNPVSVQDDAHGGWIWSIIDINDSMFATCAWDNHIKLWSIDRFEQIDSYSFERPAMSLATESGTLYAGLLSGEIILIDPRIKRQSFLFGAKKIHRGAITGMSFWNDNIVTIGEDRRMGVFDVRSQGTLLFQHVNSVYDTCPRKIALHRGVCYIGDSKGYLNMFKLGGDYAPIMCANVGVHKGINAIIPSVEGVVIGTSDVSVMFLTPSIPINIIREFDCHGEVPTIDMCDNTLIAGCANHMGLLQYFKGQ